MFGTENAKKQNIFDLWGITVDEASEIIESRPSLRGVLSGYVGEYKLKKMLLSDGRVTEIISVDNHDRSAGYRARFRDEVRQAAARREHWDDFVAKLAETFDFGTKASLRRSVAGVFVRAQV